MPGNNESCFSHCLSCQSFINHVSVTVYHDGIHESCFSYVLSCPIFIQVVKLFLPLAIPANEEATITAAMLFENKLDSMYTNVSECKRKEFAFHSSFYKLNVVHKVFFFFNLQGHLSSNTLLLIPY